MFVLLRARSESVELDRIAAQRICNNSLSLCVSLPSSSPFCCPIAPQLTHSLTATRLPTPTAVINLLLKLSEQRPQALHLPIAIHHLAFPDLGFGGGFGGGGAAVGQFADQGGVDGFEAVVFESAGVQEGGGFCCGVVRWWV